MSKNKLQRYAEIQELANVIELAHFDEGDHADIRGNWKRDVFCNENPITLELACGKGDYLLALAAKFPKRNFVGIDIKGDRIWKGAQYASNSGLNNVRYLRVFIDHIKNYFTSNEVSEIWITFPDPYPSTTKEMKRLTSPPFLEMYHNILQRGHSIHLKTDDRSLFDYTLETLKSKNGRVLQVVEDVYGNHEVPELLNIKTYYEKKHLKAGKTIMYVQFCLD
ncbi:MAG: tRNA (guanosine(46)-N7)-methyltransferase TrmB [Balneolales bacterium]